MARIGLNIFLILGGVLLALIISEGTLWLIGFSNPHFHMSDPDLGISLRPGAQGLYQKEGTAYVRINSDGLRDIEHSITKPLGTFRIVVLGDSYAEGLQINLEQLFLKVLEERLLGCNQFDQRKIEVINFGVSGYGTGLELLMLRKKVWKYQPDMVVLAFLTGNDVRNNSKALNRVEYIPYFDLNRQGDLHLDQSFLTSARYKSRLGMRADIMYSFGNNI